MIKKSVINVLLGLKRRNITQIKDFLTYALTDGLSQALPFLILPIIAEKLGPSDFGRVSNFTVLVQLFHVIIGLRIVFFYSTGYHRSSKIERDAIITNITFIYVIVAGLCLIATIFFGKTLTDNLFLDRKWQYLAIIIALFILMGQLFTSHLRMEERAKEFGKIMLTRSIISAAGSCVLVLMLGLSFPGRFYALLAASCFYCFVGIRSFRKAGFLKSKLESKRQKELLLFGLPLVPYALSPWLKSGAERILISGQLGLVENGIFALATTFASAFSLVSTAFLNTYTPRLYKNFSNDSLTKEELGRKVISQMMFFVIFFGIVLLAGYLAIWLLFKIFISTEYQKALDYLPLLLVVAAVGAITNLFKIIILYTKKTKILGIVGFSIALLQVPLTFLFIKKAGVTGAIYSALICSSLLMFAYMYLSQKYTPLPWRQYFTGGQLINKP